MAAPTTVSITAPASDVTVYSTAAGTATVGVTVASDLTTGTDKLITVKDGVATKTSGAPDVAGGFSSPALTWAIGAHSVTAVAANAEGDVTSSAKVITVLDTTATVAKADDRSVQWYLNFLSGAADANVPNSAMQPVRTAACLWAGVTEIDHGTVAALNIKAGITDPSLYVSINKALNLIAYATLNPDVCRPWLTNQGALFKIMNA